MFCVQPVPDGGLDSDLSVAVDCAGGVMVYDGALIHKRAVVSNKFGIVDVWDMCLFLRVVDLRRGDIGLSLFCGADILFKVCDNDSRFYK